MDKQQWQIIEPILDKALILEDRNQRGKYIRLACRDDDDLYTGIINLIHYIREATDWDFLENSIS